MHVLSLPWFYPGGGRSPEGARKVWRKVCFAVSVYISMAEGPRKARGSVGGSFFLHHVLLGARKVGGRLAEDLRNHIFGRRESVFEYVFSNGLVVIIMVLCKKEVVVGGRRGAATCPDDASRFVYITLIYIYVHK